jgi:hypothetical protein
MIRLASLLTVLTLTACGGKAAAPATPAPAGGPTGTLKELQNGDRACYVVVEVDGADQSIEGDFELCPGASQDASGLIGQRVTWTTKKANVQAASCQGDPDCADSDEVDLIVTITARHSAPARPAGAGRKLPPAIARVTRGRWPSPKPRLRPRRKRPGRAAACSTSRSRSCTS